MAESSSGEVTCLLRQVARGDKAAVDRLLPYVYEELRARAALYLHRERPDHTLQTTALVHEAYLRLIDQDKVVWVDRIHFFAVASTCIRRILVDYARRRQAAKRADDMKRPLVEETCRDKKEDPRELLALNEAMDHLARMDSRKARVVELRFFGGLQNAEVAEVLAVSEGTVERDLRLARAWLYRALSMVKSQ